MNFWNQNGVNLGAAAAASDNVVSHSQLPFRARARYLRLVSNLTQAKDYAAGGFHTSVDRMSAGGCSDAWSNHASGTKPYTCTRALNRDDLKTLWEGAALAYLNAYSAPDLTTAKTNLEAANMAANMAFKSEGIEPPRDPVNKNYDPVAPKDYSLVVFSGLGVASLLVGLLVGKVADEYVPEERVRF